MPSSNVTRRRVLAACGFCPTPTLAGCSRILAAADPDRALELSLSPLDGSLRERYLPDLTETRPDRDEAAFERC